MSAEAPVIFTSDENELQKDIIKAYLSRESENWLEHKAMAERAGGYSAEANTARDKSMKMINTMLEELIELPGVRDGL